MKRQNEEGPKPVSLVVHVFRGVLWTALIAGIAGAAYGLYEFAIVGPYFSIRKIEITGTHHVNPDRLRAFMGVRTGDNLLLVRSEAIRGRALAHPWIRIAKIRKSYPSDLFVEIEERTPVAALYGPCWASLHGLDIEGAILPELSIEDLRPDPEQKGVLLPIITGVVEPRMLPGDRLSEPCRSWVVGFLSRIADSKDLKGQITEIRRRPTRGYVASSRGRVERVLFGEAEIGEQVSALEQTWAFLERDKINAEYIDLRNPAQGVVLRPIGTDAEKWLRIAREAIRNGEQASFAHEEERENEQQRNGERG
jgi:cell division septal protein FtsQ